MGKSCLRLEQEEVPDTGRTKGNKRLPGITNATRSEPNFWAQKKSEFFRSSNKESP